jgi:oligogalacturonide transport system substrate-binding protein
MRTATRWRCDEFAPEDLASGVVQGRLNALPVSYTARVLLWNEASFRRAGLALPRSWDELFAAGAQFRRVLGEGAYPLDGELYDMLLLAQAWVQQQHGTPYVDPAQPRVAMTEAAALDWVRIYQRLVAEHVATPLPLRASLGGAEKPTEQQPDWVAGRWAGNYTWDSAIMLRASTLPKPPPLALGVFPQLRRRTCQRHLRPPDADVRGGPAHAARGRCGEADELPAHRPRGRAAAGPHARAAVGARPAGAAAGREPLAAAGAGGMAQQIQAARAAGRIALPSPLFEHARLQKFMREVFETVAYGKADAAAAARRLVHEGQALLQRIT